MQFAYQASTKQGKVQTGSLEAPSRNDAEQILRDQDLFVLSIQEKRKGVRFGEIELNFGRISLLDKVLFAKHLSVMLKSGMSLSESLDVIKDETTSKKMQRVITDILKNVMNGNTLASSLQRYPRVFNELISSMVKVGEESGTLDRNLEYLASELEKEYDIRKRVRGAMIYPIIVLVATFLLGSGLSIFILPKLVKLFTSLRIELPGLTKLFIALAQFLADWGIYVFLGIVAFFILLRFAARWKITKPFFHSLYLKLPIVHRLVTNINLARMTRILGTLLKSGIPIVESIKITSETVGNVLYRERLRDALDVVQRGRPLSEILGQNEKFFPKIVSRMIGVGEKTGQLDDTLLYLARFYEEEVDNATKNLTVVIEPVLLVIIGVVLGGLAIAIITPIYQISGSLRR